MKKQFEIFSKDLKSGKMKNVTLYGQNTQDAKRNFSKFYPGLEIVCVFPAKFCKI